MRWQRVATALLCSTCLALGLGVSTLSAQDGDSGGANEGESAEASSSDEAGSEKQSSDESASDEEASDEETFDAHAALNEANRLAGRGALSRSIPKYEKVLEHAYDRYPSAHFNLASVLRAKEEYARALIHLQAYIRMGDDPGTRSDAEKGVEEIKATVWEKKLAELSVDVEPNQDATIAIDGFVVAEESDIEKMDVLSGEYTVRAEAQDHHPDEKTVELEHEGAASLTFDLQKKTFYGTARVAVDEKEATIKFHPEELENERGPDEPVVRESPLDEAVELETGKWLLEVTKPKYHRWVRYIEIQRDEETQVNVELSRKLPEEIR